MPTNNSLSSRLSQLASEETQYFIDKMDKHYPVNQRMALPAAAKPPRAPYQRHSMTPPSSNVTSHPNPEIRLSQPFAKTEYNRDQNFSRAGREPVRRRKPVPMPRTFSEKAIDVPPEFECAAYGYQEQQMHNKMQLNNSVTNMRQKRPKSMLDTSEMIGQKPIVKVRN